MHGIAVIHNGPPAAQGGDVNMFQKMFILLYKVAHMSAPWSSPGMPLSQTVGNHISTSIHEWDPNIWGLSICGVSRHKSWGPVNFISSLPTVTASLIFYVLVLGVVQHSPHSVVAHPGVESSEPSIRRHMQECAILALLTSQHELHLTQTCHPWWSIAIHITWTLVNI